MLVQVLILVAGLALVVLGAEWLVEGASTIARKVGLSEFVIGMTIVGIGTSMPELVVSMAGAFKGSADIAIGNVVGSNIFNVFLILGVTALISPIGITEANRKRDIPLGILASVLLICFGMQRSLFGIGSSDTVNAVEGGIFLLLFAVYMAFSLKAGRVQEEAAPGEEGASGAGPGGRKAWVATLMVVGGLAALVFGGDKFVDSAVRIARQAGLSEKFVAITILAGGTSLPELVTCVVAASKKKDALALGNIVGSNISNILLILGASATVCPLSFANMQVVDMGMLVLSSLVLLASVWTGRNNRIGKGDGTAFLLIFAAYMAYLFMTL